MMDLLLKPELRSARAVRLRELFCSLFGVYRRHGMEQCIMYDGHDRRCPERPFI